MGQRRCSGAPLDRSLWPGDLFSQGTSSTELIVKVCGQQRNVLNLPQAHPIVSVLMIIMTQVLTEDSVQKLHALYLD